MKYMLILVFILSGCGGGDYEEDDNAAKPSHQIQPIDCSQPEKCR
jgi:hypothetical protein